jgi:hypothetical protein
VEGTQILWQQYQGFSGQEHEDLRKGYIEKATKTIEVAETVSAGKSKEETGLV